MKKIAILIALVVTGLAIYIYAPPVNLDEMMTVEEMETDYDVLRSALQEGLPTLYLYTPKDEMDTYFDKQRKSLSEPMTRLAFCRKIKETVASANDAHTQAMPGRGASSWFSKQKCRLPLKLRILDGRAYVERDYGIGEAYLGAEILKLNGKPMSDIVQKMLAFISTDGANSTGAYALMGETTDFALMYRMLYGPVTSFTIQFRKLDGLEEDVTTNGISGSELSTAYRNRYADSRPEPIRLEWRGDTPVLFFGNFGQPEVNGIPVAQFISETFEEIERRKCQNLIIDLTNNGGGDMEMPELLASYLLDQPFQLSASVTMKKKDFQFYKNCVMTPPNKFFKDMIQQPDGTWSNPSFSRKVKPMTPVFKGKIFVITAGINHSSTTLFVNALHRVNRAVFIGEEVMGSYHSFSGGMGGLLRLKNSDMMVMIPTLKLRLPPAPHPYKDRGVQPHHTVLPAMDDLVSGKHTGVEFALDLIGNGTR